jgi:MFS transporter, ACS family, glucarate transporter
MRPRCNSDRIVRPSPIILSTVLLTCTIGALVLQIGVSVVPAAIPMRSYQKSAAHGGRSPGAAIKVMRIPIRHCLAILLFALTAVAYLDRTNISIAGLQIRSQFGINNTQLGWLISAFLIGYAVFQIPAGLLARRFGPRRVMTLAVLGWALFSALTGLVPSRLPGALAMLVLVRFALGAAEAVLFPATSQFVERWFPLQELGRANGVIFAGIGIGSGITPLFVTEIVLHLQWRAAFWFSAALALAVAGAWYVGTRDLPESHPSISHAELELIRKGRRETSSAALQGRPVPWARIFRSKQVLALTVSYSACGYVAWIFFGWFYIYLAQVRGLNLRASAAWSMAPFIAMTVGCLCGGVLSDWIARRYGERGGRCLLPVVTLTLTAAFLMWGSKAEHVTSAGILLTCGAGCLYLSQNNYFAVVANIAGEFTGVVSGVMNIGAQLGGAATASLTPLIASRYGWSVSFFAAALVILLGGLAWLAVEPERSLPD